MISAQYKQTSRSTTIPLNCKFTYHRTNINTIIKKIKEISLNHLRVSITQYQQQIIFTNKIKT
jgi:hypothetical protein